MEFLSVSLSRTSKYRHPGLDPGSFVGMTGHRKIAVSRTAMTQSSNTAMTYLQETMQKRMKKIAIAIASQSFSIIILIQSFYVFSCKEKSEPLRASKNSKSKR